LVQITEGFHGPIIATDLRLGDIVYARYGGFNPIVKIDRLGYTYYSIYAADGSLVPDNYSIPFKLPENIQTPFKRISYENDSVTNKQRPSKVIGTGYLLIDLVYPHAKGSIYTAMDLRSQESVSLKILKEGRQYCLSDEYGRDMRTRLKHQENLHRVLANRVPLPKADSYFEWNGHGYLPLEYIRGKTLSSSITKPWDSLNLQQQIDMLNLLLDIINIVGQIHRLGFVHRDLTPNNFLISEDGKVYVLDFELAHHINDVNPPYGAGTPGFMSPQQQAGKKPEFYDDIFSLGSLMMMIFTCIDPSRILFARDDVWHNLRGLAKKLPDVIIDLVVDCVSDDPLKRHSISDIHDSVNNYLKELEHSKFTGNRHNSLPKHYSRVSKNSSSLSFKELIIRATNGLFKDTIKDEKSGLWISSEINNPEMGETNLPQYSLYRSANRGIAGPIYLLGCLARFGFLDEHVNDTVRKAINWILNNKNSLECQLPGLHFGNAGIAASITECIIGGLIQRTDDIDNFLLSSLSADPDWPDLTHGAAGQGIAAINCSSKLNDPEMLSFSHKYANYLIRHQKDDGSWEMPPGVHGMSGERLSGFAHGIAGIIYFLNEYDRLFDNSLARESLKLGVQWLMRHAQTNDSGTVLEWNYSESNEARWKWWCHGSPGISLTFLRLFEHTRNEDYSEIARKCLNVHPIDVRYPNLSLCHGLAGLGEIYLEAGRVLGDNEFYRRADNISSVLLHLKRNTNNRSISWIVEDPYFPTADLMVGSSGIIHFYLKYTLKDRIGFPLLLDPIRV
jgi:serine/threonine protein kinase